MPDTWLSPSSSSPSLPQIIVSLAPYPRSSQACLLCRLSCPGPKPGFQVLPLPYQDFCDRLLTLLSVLLPVSCPHCDQSSHHISVLGLKPSTLLAACRIECGSPKACLQGSLCSAVPVPVQPQLLLVSDSRSTARMLSDCLQVRFFGLLISWSSRPSHLANSYLSWAQLRGHLPLGSLVPTP